MIVYLNQHVQIKNNFEALQNPRLQFSKETALNMPEFIGKLPQSLDPTFFTEKTILNTPKSLGWIPRIQDVMSPQKTTVLSTPGSIGRLPRIS